MKILLINSNQLKEPFPVLPLGICYIASYLEQKGHTVKVLDLCFAKNIEKEIKLCISDFNPGVIGISIRNIDSTTNINPPFYLEEIKKNIIEPCKKYYTGIILLGGTALGINPLEILEYMDLNYAIQGDGEIAIADFVEKIEKKESCNKLKGLIIRTKNITEINPPNFVKNLDKLPFPSPYKYLDLKKYEKYNIPLQIQTKRGCELNCIYCTYNKIEGKKYRLRNPQKIADEIEDLVKNTGINHIEFVDSTFNMPLDHAKQILEAIINKGLKLKITSMGIHPLGIDQEFAGLMKKSGFYEIFVSLDACTDVSLKTMGKGFKTDKIFEAAKILHKKKIPIHWSLIFGAPGETEESIKEAVKTIKKASSPWDLVDIAIGIRVYNGAPIANHIPKDKIQDRQHDNFLKPYTYIPKDINLEQIEFLTYYYGILNHNFITHEKKVKIPFFITFIFKYIFPRLPMWKAYVIFRSIPMALGFYFISAKIFYLLKKPK